MSSIFHFRDGEEFRSFGSLCGKKLFKFCEQDHHPDYGSKFLRLGTLHQFREKEMKELSDEQEGFFTYHFDLHAERYTVDQSNEIMNFLDGEFSGNDITTPGGQYTKYTPNLVNAITGDGFAHISGSVFVEYSLANSFIFCMSASRDEDMVSPFPSYDRRWQLRTSEIQNFVGVLVSEVASQVEEGKIDLYYPPNLDRKFLLKPRIHVITRLVSYEKRVVSVSPSRSITSQVSEALWNAPFSKPPSFAHEKEFRILVFFSHGAIPLTLDGTPAFIPFERLRSFIA